MYRCVACNYYYYFLFFFLSCRRFEVATAKKKGKERKERTGCLTACCHVAFLGCCAHCTRCSASDVTVFFPLFSLVHCFSLKTRGQRQQRLLHLFEFLFCVSYSCAFFFLRVFFFEYAGSTTPFTVGVVTTSVVFKL